MFTREDYIGRKCTHEQYYGQFVTPKILALVEDQFGKEQLKDAISKDVNFNTIPLIKWDNIATFARDMFYKMNDNSLAGGVCLLKEAARQIATS